MFNWVSDNALISGFGKAPIKFSPRALVRGNSARAKFAAEDI